MTDSTIFNDVTAYWDNRARHFNGAASHVRHEAEWAHVLTAAFEADGPLDILDLGTGTGACAIVAASLGHRLTAIDGSAEMLAEAKAAAMKRSLQIDFRQGSIEQLAIAPSSFDIVTIRNVLWTLADPAAALQSARRILRPGGRVVVSDGLWSHSPENRSTYPRTLVERLPFHAGLSEGACRTLLDAAGFDDTRSWHHMFAENPYPGDIPFFVVSSRAASGTSR